MIDLRHKFGPVEQQGAPNSCVAHAATSTLEAILGVSDLSRLFVYYNARLLANQQNFDAGCQPRNAMRGISMYGAPPETSWVYDVSRLTARPDTAAYTAGALIKPRVKSFQTVTSLTSLKTALGQELPVLFAFSVPDTFLTAAKFDGYLPMFTSSTKWIGSHAVVACGFDDSFKAVLCRNSFGSNWGQGGYFWMDYGWFTRMTSSRVTDAWTFIPV